MTQIILHTLLAGFLTNLVLTSHPNLKSVFLSNMFPLHEKFGFNEYRDQLNKIPN